MSFFKSIQTTKEEKQKPTQPNQPQEQEQEELSNDMLANVSKLKKTFSYPTNNALKIRNLYLPSYEKNVTVLYIEGTIDVKLIDSTILEPLLKKPDSQLPKIDFVSILITTVLVTASTKIITTLEDAASDLLNGNTIILIGEEACAVSVETAKL